jgi:two-component system, OmpR family, alkaline phosphatase synthesis response regulator PhoP
MPQRTILVADDETHILNVVSIKLQNAGFRVITAEDGAEAYELARSARPDLVITDYQMPRLSGLELCTKLHADPVTADIPAIILTARGFALSDRDRALDNIREVIAKPFSPRQVLTSVYALLDEVYHREQLAVGACAETSPK